jgi:hypothetical protein
MNPVVAALVGVLATAQSVAGASFRCTAADVACLISAINIANANGQVNTITLAAGTYMLTAIDNTIEGPNGLPSITSPLTIRGAGAGATIIAREANASPFRILHVVDVGTLTLSRVSIQGGVAASAREQFSGRGGAIFNRGSLTLIATTIRNNAADDSGGAIFSETGAVTISRSFIVGNTTIYGGGGIASVGGTVTIDWSVISGNADRFGGGGIAIGPGANDLPNTLTIANSRVSGNTTGGRGGGIISGGTLIVTNSTISDNVSRVGGGISALENWVISGSTISGNTAREFGGGLENADGAGLIVNSTVSHNSSARGGGIDGTQGLTISISNTVADNNADEGAGLFNGGDGTPVLLNTILARNTTGPAGPESNCSGNVISFGNNLIGDPTGCTIVLQGTDLTGDPGLGSFTDNGLPGQGHFPLLPSSGAIDAGNDGVCPHTDQLGRRRVGRCDIGAIEFRPAHR